MKKRRMNLLLCLPAVMLVLAQSCSNDPLPLDEPINSYMEETITEQKPREIIVEINEQPSSTSVLEPVIEAQLPSTYELPYNGPIDAPIAFYGYDFFDGYGYGYDDDDGDDDDDDDDDHRRKRPKDGICGDSIVDQNEECDDGNTADDDGCSATCKIEDAPAECGDGTTDDGEECDDGNTEDDDGCSATCKIEDSPAECGDGNLDEGEECDDGNNKRGDGCSPMCKLPKNRP